MLIQHPKVRFAVCAVITMQHRLRRRRWLAELLPYPIVRFVAAGSRQVGRAAARAFLLSGRLF
jgi:hypothetical protein